MVLRFLPAFAAFGVVFGGVAAPAVASAQSWNDARTQALVTQATTRRAQQLADTGLVDYQALAHGYLTFLGQIGEGFPEPPKIIKADELALEVYWHAPNLSKQRIVGRRDTLLLPTDINYHRDHLGIVQNNFPNVIRVGEGDEVRDVPHPLSAAGLATYDYAITDSLRIALPDRAIDVYEVKVRPKDPSRAATVGAVYIDKSEGQVVRMAFSFTRAALIDQELEDVSIVLENSLIEGRFWLPRRQEVEIRRTGTWLDFPARGIIRGRWEICCYKVNLQLPVATFAGPEIVQSPTATLKQYQWHGQILDSLPPDVRVTTDEDVRRVQEEARRLVRAEALARSRTLAFSAHALSDIARVNRVEGLAVGGGISRRLGLGFITALSARYGLDDRAVKGLGAIGWQRADGAGLRLLGYRTYRDAGDEPETSTLRNSIAAQEFGSDYTEPYDAYGGGVAADLGTYLGMRWQLEGDYEAERALAVHAKPASGHYEPVIPAWSLRGPRASLVLTRPTGLSLFGTELRGRAEVRATHARLQDAAIPFRTATFARTAASVHLERPFGADRLVARTTAAVAWGGARVAPQDLVFLGGPTSGPGYDFHEFVGLAGATQHLEWRHGIPFPAILIGRFGTTGSSATLAPFAHTVYIARPAAFRATRRGWYPSVGLGLLSIFDLLRVDVARGLRQGRWTFSVDVAADFWRIL